MARIKNGLNPRPPTFAERETRLRVFTGLDDEESAVATPAMPMRLDLRAAPQTSLPLRLPAGNRADRFTLCRSPPGSREARMARSRAICRQPLATCRRRSRPCAAKLAKSAIAIRSTPPRAVPRIARPRLGIGTRPGHATADSGRTGPHACPQEAARDASQSGPGSWRRIST